MSLLVLNAGSSTLKSALFGPDACAGEADEPALSGVVDWTGHAAGPR